MKRKLNLLLGSIVLTACFALPTFAAVSDTGFSDVDADNIYADGIEYCVNNGIIRRTDVTEFSPDEQMNRELLACVLYRLEESPATETEISFSDVGNGRWFQTGVLWAAENNILIGYGDGSFGVDEGITREQFITALWRYTGNPVVTGEISFNDRANISTWAEQAVIWAEQNNIINDRSMLEPKTTITRGEAAEIIMNFLKIKETPYMLNGGNNVTSIVEEAEFIDRVRLTIDGVDGEAIVSLIDSKPTREFIAQLPMTVAFSDFGDREKFGKMPVAISENEALLSGYEIGDFSYGTPYDCMIMFYDQDNEVIDGIIKLGTFESGLDLFTGKEDINVTIEAISDNYTDNATETATDTDSETTETTETESGEPEDITSEITTEENTVEE